MKTVGELVHSLDLEDIIAALKRLYQGEGESEEGYREVWAKLKVMQPQQTTMTCVLWQAYSLGEPFEPYVDVSGDDGSEHSWAIEFRPWSEWLSMPINIDKRLGAMPETEQLAHCLYEMTWAGYDQETVAEHLEDIHEKAEEVKKMLNEEKPH